LRFNEHSYPEILRSASIENKMGDGEKTIFNMISGQIDCADDRNSQLIAEGLTVYKELRPFTHCAYPILPNACSVMYLYDFDENYIELIAKATDLFLWDFKEGNTNRHKKNTGVSNEKILHNVFLYGCFHSVAMYYDKGRQYGS
jgi:hypothetical protein